MGDRHELRSFLSPLRQVNSTAIGEAGLAPRGSAIYPPDGDQPSKIAFKPGGRRPPGSSGSTQIGE